MSEEEEEERRFFSWLSFKTLHKTQCQQVFVPSLSNAAVLSWTDDSLIREWSNHGVASGTRRRRHCECWHAPHLEVVTTGLGLNYCTKRLCLYPVKFYITQPQQQQGRDCVLL